MQKSADKAMAAASVQLADRRRGIRNSFEFIHAVIYEPTDRAFGIRRRVDQPSELRFDPTGERGRLGAA
jgi:hypothetical protein